MKKYNNILVKKINEERKTAEHQELRQEIAKQLQVKTKSSCFAARKVIMFIMQTVIIVIFIVFIAAAINLIYNPEMISSIKENTLKILDYLFK